MDLAARLKELQQRTLEHREVLLTEEAAKNALVMPFIQALGYDVFNPGEVIPEFCADVGTKKGEKVDYAICKDGKVSILVECKPASVELGINHAGQLFRYFSVTEARLAILTNGVIFQFYSDVERPNKMDDKPFFTFSMAALKPADLKTIEAFSKATFDIERIVKEAGNLKLQSLIRKELEREFAEPSPEFVGMLAKRSRRSGDLCGQGQLRKAGGRVDRFSRPRPGQRTTVFGAERVLSQGRRERRTR